ncbi:hypothetical protein [Arthrobacter sp. M4]|uniref:hypothetical protein n=1 Tax=Arthrobacter sp. M4 TaxID=218160 RepID=UPI001CDB6773|nr:hypothetical protein [Arthrobacter sp. M4]MCA4133900.1 hypothetical protein [Arthrobacter sp. M4]
MSTMHRVFANAFRQMRRTVRAGHAAVPAQVPSLAVNGAGELSCSPWAGLYLENADAA